ncbi:MAG: Rieske 2Fe-2S domain-containing protein, partial [Trueperaceae bacterium]
DPDPTFEPGPAVPIAPLTAFDEVWAEAPFDYRFAPSLAIRLPDPVPGGLTIDAPGDAATDASPLHLAAFSRVCTHQGCLVTLNRDVEAVAFAFNHRADGPSLTCGCHLSVFAPDRAGRAVAGPAVRPLPRVRLERDGDMLIATGVEGADPTDAPYNGERAI